MDLASLRDRRLSLSDLVRVVGELARRLVRADDDRVRAAPDERTIRYYQSTGLLDRPIAYEGRSAVYGYRHVLQATAVKALQGHGYSLAQVQAALAGATDALLERAVTDAIGGASNAPPLAAPLPPAATWRTVEISAGVLVTVDLARIVDPDALIQRLLAALPPTPGEQP